MKRSIFTLILSWILFSCTTKESRPEVNIYSHRHYEVDKQIYKDFENKYNIKVNILKADAEELINKISIEGENTFADILITVDASRLNRANKLGLLKPIKNDALFKNIASSFISEDSSWVGLTYRGRVIAYNPEKINDSLLSTYQDLISEKWRNKILVRTSNNVYNQTLLSSIIYHQGKDSALVWAKGIVANMARNPKGNDRDQIKAMIYGEGDLAIINTYYLGLLLNSKNVTEVSVGKKTALFFPNQNTTGTHINISGAGLVKHSKHEKNAIKLLQYLTSKEVQEKYAAVNFEYPVNSTAEISPLLKSWGKFTIDTAAADTISQYYKEAINLMKEANWK
tara:strand:- start:4576 stop:5595 length:1020 start_codon:yes stop_codon:yes gene_type:complete